MANNEAAAGVVVLVTAGSPEEARRISDALLQARAAACVSIVEGLKSSDWWQG